MKKGKLIYFLIVAVIVIVTACSSAKVENASGNNSDKAAENTTYNLSEGMTMPNVVVETNNGETFDLSKTEKPVLINFWATWCPPCKAEMPGIQNVYEEYKDKMDFILIDEGEPKSDVDEFIKEATYTFPVGYDEDNVYGIMFNIDAIPTTYIVGKDKTIKKYILGSTEEETFKEYIESVINE